jgi:3-deoxy-D-manno-octulosonic-acid transferase
MTLFYHTVLLAALVFFSPVILPLVLASKKRRTTVLQRLALIGVPEGKGACGKRNDGEKKLWIHALSVGETIASVELLKKLRKDMPNARLYFSTSTATGFDEANKTLGSVADMIFFYPYDFIFAVRRVLRRICPSAFILVESDIWPTFLLELQKTKVPAVLVNGRLSPASFAGYKRLSFLMKPVFNTFRTVCVQSEEQGARFESIGVAREKIRVTGSIKFDRKVPTLDQEARIGLRKKLGATPNGKVLLAGSTHPGEESVLLEAFALLKPKFPDLTLVLVPRDHERADEVVRMAVEAGCGTQRMSRNESDEAEVLVVDVMGVLASLYAVADVAFVGGSLAPFGGHNPLEPAAFAKPILFGPDMSDFPEISRMLLDAKGAVQVRNARQLAETASNLLSNPRKAENLGRNAFELFQANQGAVQRTAAIVSDMVFR